MKKVLAIIKYVFLILILLWTLFPMYWMLVNSFKDRVEIFSHVPTFIPQNFTLENYKKLFIDLKFGIIILNSLKVAFFSTVVVIIIATLSAYAISRYNFIGKKTLNLWIILVRIFPPVAFVVPLYLILRNLNILNTHLGLILLYIIFNLPFAVWMLINFINEIPIEIEESGMIDGASPLKILLRLIIPLLLPGLGATAIFTFIASWNEFMFALIFLQSPKLVTVPVALSGLITEYLVLWGPMSAGGIISLVPILLFVILMQDYIVKGLTLGSIKG
ncbi:ABC-type sugar transport system, permease component [Thermoanaerobacter sp. YS13]|uniref:carbohydrate ABC transporter permease n=1 Tax=Thermoanaerobacter sp. YS13 TaxID=1511746 RepID=UPI000574DE57|nr:carbohydrate ABC transporter permease [Thermoanaerobacter sp. YS13]KHO61669.1 ABC-type sugar transport system, permease component [Thermoanaerobacter sp. YS13]